LGSEAMSAVQIGGTILLLIQIPGYMLGIGGSISAGILLGKRDRAGASRLFSSTIAATVILGVVFMFMAVFSRRFALMLAGDNILTGDVAAVIQVTFIGAPLIGIALQLMNYMAVDNNPSLATWYVVLSNVINLVADYFLLKYTSLGVQGAIWSTLIGYTVALVVLIPYIRSPKRMLSLVNPFKNTGEVFKMAVITGIPSMLSIVCEMIRNWVMNIIIIKAAGENAVAVYTICLNLVMICELFLGGIIGTMATIGGVVYGEKDYFGIKSLSKNIIIYSYAMLAVLTVLLLVFTKQAASMFGIADGALMDMTVTAIRIFVFSLPFYVACRFLSTYYQTTEKTWLSNLIMVLDYCAALLPCAIAAVMIAKAMGFDSINAVMAAFIVGEGLAVLITVFVVKLKYRTNILMLPEHNEETVLDISISPDIKEAVKVPQAILEFCKDKIDPVKATQIAVAAEEMTVNVIKHGGKDVKSIDVMLSLTDDRIILRTRDSGIPFDPTDYTYDSEEFEFSGIEVIKKLTNKITYMRMLDFNNTTVEIEN
ncbi:MAG: polysaccharide biosynthesis C-terminal domain-containing protein, partial [Clostridia bacterium]|nr:polysaccharide biosynthesis C-terminal domain-containing protein [Clostridia bacterium]